MDKKANRDKRYKNLSYKKTKPVEEIKEKETISLPENTLPNNWSKYEITENDDQPDGADFETLLQEPICNESHFKFKSEQNWDADINSQLELNKYFTLDLKLLGEGISTIPFPKRHNYNENLFTQLELDSIRKHSETNTQKYKKYLEKKYPTKDNKIVIKKNVDEIMTKLVSLETDPKRIESNKETNELKVQTNELQTEVHKTTEKNLDISKQTKSIQTKIEPKSQREIEKHEDDVDDLLNIKSFQENISEEAEIKAEDPLMQSTKLQKVVLPESTVDLEEWLDDILDD